MFHVAGLDASPDAVHEHVQPEAEHREYAAGSEVVLIMTEHSIPERHRQDQQKQPLRPVDDARELRERLSFLVHGTSL